MSSGNEIGKNWLLVSKEGTWHVAQPSDPKRALPAEI